MSNKSLKSGHRLQKLTPKESQVLQYICNEFLTIKQIAIRRKTSVQAIYKIKKGLIKKGFLTTTNEMVEKNLGTLKPLNDFKLKRAIRLHAIELNIQILYKDKRYKEKIGTIPEIDGNTVKCNTNSIEVYLNKMFYAETALKATAESIKYINRIIPRIEDELKIIISKPRCQNIKVVNNHYAEIDNELAKEAEIKGLKYRIYGTDDGKLWFTIDNSFNLHEAETLHPQTAEADMENTIQPFFNDLRDNRLPKLSELVKIIAELAQQNKETAAGLNAVVKLMQPNLRQEEPEVSQDKPEYIG